jgi:hypothetical protein
MDLAQCTAWTVNDLERIRPVKPWTAADSVESQTEKKQLVAQRTHGV